MAMLPPSRNESGSCRFSGAAKPSSPPPFPSFIRELQVQNDFRPKLIAVIAGSLLATLVGCSGGAVASVSGTVTAEGAPVTGGNITLVPVAASADPAAAGKSGTGPVSAEIKPDGTFKFTDNASAGKHRVMYSSPSVEWEAPEYDGVGPPPVGPPIPYSGMKPKDEEVTVEAGPNTLTIELVK